MFQFTDTLFCQFYKRPNRMLVTRKSNEILRSVIILNSIKVVDNPAFRQFLVMFLFPDKTMFTNTPSIPAIPNFNIPIGSLLSATFPTRMSWSANRQLLSILAPAFRTQFGSTTTSRLTTINARIRMIQHVEFRTSMSQAIRTISGVASNFDRLITQLAIFHINSVAWCAI